MRTWSVPTKRCRRSVKRLNGSEDSLKDLLSVLDDTPEQTAMEEHLEEVGLPVYEETGSPEPMDSTSAYSSQTLLNLPSKLLPKKDFTCMFCPAAMWLVKGDAVTCFCRMMRKEIFTSAEEDSVPVLLCDGPYLAEEEAR